VSLLLMPMSPHNTSKGLGMGRPQTCSCGHITPSTMRDSSNNMLLGTACFVFSKGILYVQEFLGVKRAMVLRSLQHSKRTSVSERLL